MSLLILPFSFLFFQYILGAAIIIALSLFIIHKFKANTITISLLSFGILIAVWEILVFFHRVAGTAAESLSIFRISGIVGPYIYGFYFLIFLNIWKSRKRNLICLTPSIIGSIISLTFESYEVVPGAYGWAYRRLPVSPNANLAIFGSTAVYMLIIIVVLIYLLAKSPSKDLKAKFLDILLAFVMFQVVGLLVTNVFLIQNNPSFPPLGGLLYLGTFAAISYTIFSPANKKEVPTSKLITQKTLLSGFLQSLYASFETQSADTLGSKYFRLLPYIKECGLENIIRLDNSQSFRIDERKEENINASQLSCLVDKTLSLLEKGEVDPKFIGDLIAFIDQTYDKTSVELAGIFKVHENYLRKSQILYKVANGKFQLLFVPEGFDEQDLERFSSPINLIHKELEKTQILFKFSTGKNYAEQIREFVLECLANGEKVYIFTRRESQIHMKLEKIKDVNYFFLSPSTSRILKVGEKEEIIPISDLSQVLGSLMTIKNYGEASAVVFDNLTDILLLTSFEQTYKVARHALDIMVTSRVHSLFLINKDVHDKNIISAFEALYKLAIA